MTHAVKKGNAVLTEKNAAAVITSTLIRNPTDYEKITVNLNSLIAVMQVNITELAHFLNFNASYLSRIPSGNEDLLMCRHSLTVSAVLLYGVIRGERTGPCWLSSSVVKATAVLILIIVLF